MTDILPLGDTLIPLLAIISSSVVAITWVVAACYRKVQMAEMETALKMEMIQRGMSADEIERILRAKMVSSEGKPSRKAMSPAA